MLQYIPSTFFVIVSLPSLELVSSSPSSSIFASEPDPDAVHLNSNESPTTMWKVGPGGSNVTVEETKSNKGRSNREFQKITNKQ